MDAIVFYKSFFEAIEDIPEEEQLQVYRALFKHYFYDEEINVKGSAKAILRIMVPLIDNASARYKASVENGKKGGAPYGNQNARKYPKEENNLKQPRNNLNKNININNNINKNMCESSVETTAEITPSFSHTTTPSLSDIIAYGNSLGANSDYCERFYNHYESIGWVNANGIKIKNWKLTLNNWYKKDLESGKIKKVDTSRRLG